MAVRRLSDVIVKGENNFNLVRLVAVMAVLWGHQWLHFGGSHPDYVRGFIGIEYSGSLAVYAFFLISGILVTASAENQGSPWRFAALRFARIWPALAVCNVLVLVVAGPLLARVDAMEFWTLPFTSMCLEMNLTIVNGMCTAHPMLFKGAWAATTWANPFWTLSLEVHCYIVVAVLGCTPILRNAFLTTVVGCELLAAFLFATHAVPPKAPLWFDFSILDQYSFYPIPFFLFGMIIYAWRDHLIIDIRICLALIALYFTTRSTAFGQPALYAALVYGTLTFSGSRSVRRLGRFEDDYSYGIYIYGYVVGQAVASCFPSLDSVLGITCTGVASLGIAALSWHLVEKPSLRLCRRLLSLRRLSRVGILSRFRESGSALLGETCANSISQAGEACDDRRKPAEILLEKGYFEVMDARIRVMDANIIIATET